jgi:hypothetical protein
MSDNELLAFARGYYDARSTGVYDQASADKMRSKDAGMALSYKFGYDCGLGDWNQIDQDHENDKEAA